MAGAPEGHTADGAEQKPPATPQAGTPQAGGQTAEQTQQTTVQADGQGQPVDGQSPSASEPSQQAAEQAQQTPGFGERGRMRRRARFLRRARELAYRDLGGLVFDLHRFGQRNDQLVLAKLAMLRQIDTEVRELERALGERRPVTVLREVGIAACPRCAALHDSDDRFCPGCGLAFDTNADLPISTAPMAPQMQTTTPTPAPAPDRRPAVAPAPKQTAPPVGARPVSRAPFKPAHSPPASSEPDKPDKTSEDEPTQVLRPQESDK
ncbi:MAG: zinc ribbon domain-containing protein [Solirubrobacteraceae bacterium]